MQKVALVMLSLLSLLLTSAALAKSRDSVAPCWADQYMTERIKETVPVDDQLAITNAKGEFVGVFGRDLPTGALYSLYLCGRNSGYYYAEGNIHRGEVEAIYNDEYESELEVTETSSGYKITMFVEFVGEPESADYPSFLTEVFVKTK